MTIEIDFLQKKNIDSNPYDTDKMAAEFIQQFNSQAFSVGQQVGSALGLKHHVQLVRDHLRVPRALQRLAEEQELFLVQRMSL